MSVTPNFWRYLACHFFLCYFLRFTISEYKASLYYRIENFLLSSIRFLDNFIRTYGIFANYLFALVVEVFYIAMLKRLCCWKPLVRVEDQEMFEEIEWFLWGWGEHGVESLLLWNVGAGYDISSQGGLNRLDIFLSWSTNQFQYLLYLVECWVARENRLSIY